MRPVLKLVHNDLKQFFMDRGAMVLSFIVPAVMAVIFGFTFGGTASDETRKIDFDCVDLDKSDISQKIIDAIEAEDMVAPHFVSEEEAYKNVKNGKRTLALIVPKGFGDKVKAGEEVNLKVIYDPGNQFEYAILSGIIQGAIFSADLGEYTIPAMIDNIMHQQGENEAVIAIARGYVNKYVVPWMRQQSQQNQEQRSEDNASENEEQQNADPFGDFIIGIENEQIVGKDVDTTAAYVQAVISSMLIFLMFGISFGASTLLREKKKGTLKRLLISPLTVSGILTAKLIGLTILGLMQIYFMLIVGWLVFHLQIWDYPGQLFLMAIASALMASGLGVMISGIARTEEQVSMLVPLIAITISAIGGAMVPRFYMPGFIKQIGIISPITWSMEGFHNVFWQHQGVGGMISEFLILLAFALVFLVVGISLVSSRIRSM